jgi:hypothetical protein
MYLVLSALTSSPISLAAATKASAFSFIVFDYTLLIHLINKITNFLFHCLKNEKLSDYHA